jgi:hypothetical protein
MSIKSIEDLLVGIPQTVYDDTIRYTKSLEPDYS